VDRLPDVEEYTTLIHAVGWTQFTNFAVVAEALRNSLYCVVAHSGEEAVGMARLVGDGASYFHVQDVMVLPSYQKQGIGSALVEAVMAHVQRAAPHLALVGLFTGRNLAGFYGRWGFEGPETSLYGMSIKRW
jgi:GNAT superfamily N-acetyltransferase